MDRWTGGSLSELYKLTLAGNSQGNITFISDTCESGDAVETTPAAASPGVTRLPVGQ